MKKNKSPYPLRIAVAALLILWGVLQSYPIYYLIISSLKDSVEVVSNVFGFPRHPTLQNYFTVFSGSHDLFHFSTFFANSVFVLVFTEALLVVCSLSAGYALSRFPFKGHQAVYVGVACLLGIPMHSLMVPVFLFFRNVGLLSNLVALCFVYAALMLPFSIIVMKSYFEGIPKMIDEAAQIDGCSLFQQFLRIGVPMSKSAIATVVIVNMIGIWSELMFASAILMNNKSRTLPIAISFFQTGRYSSTQSQLMAALSIAALPLMICYIIFQKQIVEGMSAGAIK